MVGRLSVGEISTLIAAGVFVIRFILPNAFALILVRLLGQQQNAATWGFAQRSLANTDWSTILRTDSMANKAVETKIRILNWLQIIFTVVLAIAAVLTPAGLYDTIRQDTSLTPTTFSRAQDEGVFGISSQISNEWPWRICQGYYWLNDSIRMDVNCPGSNQPFTVTQNSSGYYQDWEGTTHFVSVNKSRAEIYHSGLADLEYTVSSFFDIKARRIKRSAGPDTDGYLPVDAFKYLQNVIDANRYQVIEGLVVDAVNGGIGFRNHTIPENVPLGTSWKEDLLFWELDAACVDLNLSFVFDVSYVNSSKLVTSDIPFSLVDDGGFANLDLNAQPEYPAVTQDDLSLHQRTQTTAYWALWWTMRQPLMNLSDTTTGDPDPSLSAIGQQFDSADAYSSAITQTNSVGILPLRDGLYSNIIGYNSSDNTTSQLAFDSYNTFDACSGWNKSDLTNPSSIPISCNLFVGAPLTLDGKSFDIADEGTTLKRKIYAYSAAIKATIKTVEFIYNTTGDTPLENLRVLNIQDKNYSSQNSMPLWGLETPPLYNGNFNPLWGLVSDEYEDATNITTMRAPHMYPVFWPSSTSLTESYYSSDSYLTGSWALTELFGYVTNMGFTDDGSLDSNGANSALLFRRWQEMSQNPESAASIIKLIFTNMAANHIQGTRGWLSEDVVPPPFRNLTGARTSAVVPTFVRERVVHFRWPYGIPAFLSLLFVSALVLAGAGCLATGSVQKLKEYLSLLSAGRLLVDLLPGGAPEGINYNNYQEKYKRWTQTAGQKRIQAFDWGWKPSFASSPVLLQGLGPGSGNEKEAPTAATSDLNYNGVASTTSIEARPFLVHRDGDVNPRG